jgi:hypothetical protein
MKCVIPCAFAILVLVAKIYGVGTEPNPVSGNKDTRMNADTLFRVEVVWSPPAMPVKHRRVNRFLGLINAL